MKIALLSGLFFLFGLSVGIGLMYVVIYEGPDKVIAGESDGILEMNVVYATLLHDGRDADLARLFERQMAASLVFQDKLCFDDQYHTSARLVRGYYDITGTQPSPDLVPYIKGVQGNDVRRLAASVADHSK